MLRAVQGIVIGVVLSLLPLIARSSGTFDAQGTSLVLAAVHPPVLELWRRGGVIDAIGADAVFETVSDAVHAVNGRTA